MRNYRITRHILWLAIVSAGAGLCRADVVDRIALVVGKTVFTQSEVDDEARLEALQAAKPLDLSPASRKEAAERLVDQQLLRDEMKATAFQAPATDADALLRRFRQEHFASIALYRAALTRYGVTEEALKQHLLWEVTLIAFTDSRFRPFAAGPEAQTANRADANASSTATADQSADQAMDAWLKQQRSGTRVVFKQEAFR